MKKFNALIFLGVLFAVFACNPKVTKTLVKTYPPVDYRQELIVIGLDENIPDNAEDIGSLKIGDSGFTTNCDYELVIEEAKAVARKAGGNAIKITEHLLPSAFGSSCHRIRAEILYISDIESLEKREQVEGNIIPDADYAIINVYRYGGPGALVNYDLFLGNKLVCRVRNNFKTSVKVKIFGMNSLWAKTESKSEVPVTIEAGKQYYVRCGLKMGAFVGRPSLELVSYKIGKSEYESFNAKHN